MLTVLFTILAASAVFQLELSSWILVALLPVAIRGIGPVSEGAVRSMFTIGTLAGLVAVGTQAPTISVTLLCLLVLKIGLEILDVRSGPSPA